MDAPATIRILGIPWTVAYVDLVDDDASAANGVEHWRCVIEMANDLALVKQGWHLFWGILRAIDDNLFPGGTEPRDLDVIHASLYAAIADNWPTISQWFGEAPDVRECTLRLLGMDIPLKRPHRVPGHGGSLLGEARYQEAVLYVRSDLTPHKAAAVALHEMAHFVLQPICRQGTDEAFIRPFASALAQVFFDNPAVMQRIFEGAQE